MSPSLREAAKAGAPKGRFAKELLRQHYERSPHPDEGAGVEHPRPITHFELTFRRSC